MSQTNIHLLQQNYTTVSAVYLNEIEIEEILSLADGEIVSDYYREYAFKADLDLQLKAGDLRSFTLKMRCKSFKLHKLMLNQTLI